MVRLIGRRAEQQISASPMIFINVPPWSNTISVMPVRYSFNSGPMVSPAVLRQRREAGDVGEHRGDVAPLRIQVDVLRSRGQQVRQAGRKIPGQLRAARSASC